MSTVHRIFPSAATPSPALRQLDDLTAASARPDNGAQCARRVRLLRLAQVRERTGLAKSTLYMLQAEGNFPMRVKITSRAVAWIEDEVEAWLAQRVETKKPLPSM